MAGAGGSGAGGSGTGKEGAGVGRAARQAGAPDGQVTFLDGTYRETLDLLHEARDYVAGQQAAERAGLAPLGRLALSCETMRLTARLTQVMAWLLMQKAVQAGEVARDAACAPEHRLAGQAACLRVAPPVPVEMPPRLRSLLARSHSLYRRVERLDALLDRQGRRQGRADS